MSLIEAAPTIETAPRGGARPSVDSPAPRALVADTDGLARNALREALAVAGFSVVGQATDTAQILNLVQRCQPDVMVLDACLPPAGGLAALEEALAVSPDALVVVLAASGDDEAGVRALEKGAVGYLSRDTELASLARAVWGVTVGEAAISRSLGCRVIERLQLGSHPTSGMRPIKSALTTREWEVLDFMIEGLSTAEVARTLVLSPETVQSHMNHILRKLHAHSRAEAIEIAERERLRANGAARLPT